MAEQPPLSASVRVECVRFVSFWAEKSTFRATRGDVVFQAASGHGGIERDGPSALLGKGCSSK